MSDQLIELFAEGLDLPAESLNEDTSPDNTTEWDSLAAMTMVSLIEETFDVQLGTRDIMKMRTIGMARAVLDGKGISV